MCAVAESGCDLPVTLAEASGSEAGFVVLVVPPKRTRAENPGLAAVVDASPPARVSLGFVSVGVDSAACVL